MRQLFEGETQEDADAEQRDIESVRPNKEVWEIDQGSVLNDSFLVLADHADDALRQAKFLKQKRHDEVSSIRGIRKVGVIFVPKE